MTVPLTFDPRTVKPGDVIFAAPGFNRSKHAREARRDFLKTAKRLTTRVGPAVFGRFEALMAQRKPWPAPYREEVLAWVVSLGITAAEREDKRAERSRAQFAARKLAREAKGGAA